MTAPARQSRTAWRDVATSVLCVAVLGFVLLDGAASAQAQERFDRTGCGSIVDHATQLEWYVGPDTNVAWSDALSWVRRLDACGGGWHMPTLGQLQSLFDARSTAGTGYFTRGRHWPAHLDPIFSGIGAGSWVWAGEPAARSGIGHPALNFNQDLNVVLEPGRDYTVRAFAVRAAGTALPPPSIPTPNERVPVVIAARPDAESACGKGVVFDLDPHGDGFLAVKAGPGLTFLRIDKLYNGEQVYLCARAGDWYGIVYAKEAQPCHVDRPWVLSEPYTGPCRYGWAHGRWIKPVALPEIAQPSPPVPAPEPVATGDEQLEALLSRAQRKESRPLEAVSPVSCRRRRKRRNPESLCRIERSRPEPSVRRARKAQDL
jgi:hypothetical protein